MKEINGKIDINDLAHVMKKHGVPVVARPCPVVDGKINPHVSAFLMENGKCISVFHVKPIYYEHIDGTWRPLSEVLDYHGNHKMILKPDWDTKMHPRFLQWLLRRQSIINGHIAIPSPYGKISPITIRENREIFFLTGTYYPDPNPETTTVDGTTRGPYLNNSWAGERDAATGYNLPNGSGTEYAGDAGTEARFMAVGRFHSQVYFIYRGYFLFDTSSLTSGAIISASTLDLYTITESNQDDDGDDWYVLLQSNPTSNTALTSADYQKASDTLNSPTEGSNRQDISTVTGNAYNSLTLNATGLGWISKTGVSKFGIREGHDVINSPLSGPDNSWRTNSLITRFADYTGTDYDPKLVVTYTAPIVVTSNFFQFF